MTDDTTANWESIPVLMNHFTLFITLFIRAGVTQATPSARGDYLGQPPSRLTLLPTRSDGNFIHFEEYNVTLEWPVLELLSNQQRSLFLQAVSASPLCLMWISASGVVP